MKKRLLKYLVTGIALALTLLVGATPALAYDAVNGSSNALSFNKYLIVRDTAQIPAMTFTYAITPGAAADATSNSPAILAGVGSPTAEVATFTSGEQAYDSLQTGDSLTLDSNEKYAKQTVGVDFSSVSFNQPGIYRYVLTEDTSPNNKAVIYDTQVGEGGTSRTRFIDVYVTDNDGILKVSSYVLHKTTNVSVVANDDDVVEDKSSGFVNEIESYDLTFGKEVIGNQGSKDKYFKFTLAISNAQAGTSYAVDLEKAEQNPSQNSATTYSSMSNPASITMIEIGAKTVEFYLKDGQYITVKGLPKGFKYALSEEAEDYTGTNGIAAAHNALQVAHEDPVQNETSSTGAIADIKTGFTNQRSGTVPTGVIVTVAPFVIGILLFGAAIIYILNKRRRELYL